MFRFYKLFLTLKDSTSFLAIFKGPRQAQAGSGNGRLRHQPVWTGPGPRLKIARNAVFSNSIFYKLIVNNKL